MQGVRFDSWAAAVLAMALLSACGESGNRVEAVPSTVEATYGYSQQRTFFNGNETRIAAGNVASMRLKWRYLTGAVITASPTVARLELPDEGEVRTVIAASWDGYVYALRASNGTPVWRFAMKPHPGASFPQASSAEVTRIDGGQRVYVAGGMTVYCLEAASGALLWQFDAGTGCTTCDDKTERNEVLSSPTVVGGLVYFGMDVNDDAGGKGGAYAVDALDGHLVWFFDLESGATCRPYAADQVHRFDGYHSAAALGLPADFFASRPGCDFDRSGTGCGNVWSSFAVDPGRRLLYTASSNCDTDSDPNTLLPPPPMPPYDEAIFALTFDGDPAWVWRPRQVDNHDLAFGGVPNLFTAEIGGAAREVVGVGNKDGTYYLLDRDGVNEMSGRVEPYWSTKVVPGGAIGGVIASAAAGEGRVYFGTAIGVSIEALQSPSAWALGAADGVILWSNADVLPSFSPTTAIPGVVFSGSIAGFVDAFDASSGALLKRFNLGGPVSSGVAVDEGEIFVGAGTGARGGSPAEAAFQTSLMPSAIHAFCLPEAADCPAETCDDGDACTYDFHGDSGCESQPAPDGITCKLGASPGTCHDGRCEAAS